MERDDGERENEGEGGRCLEPEQRSEVVTASDTKKEERNIRGSFREIERGMEGRERLGEGNGVVETGERARDATWCDGMLCDVSGQLL